MTTILMMIVKGRWCSQRPLDALGSDDNKMADVWLAGTSSLQKLCPQHDTHSYKEQVQKVKMMQINNYTLYFGFRYSRAAIQKSPFSAGTDFRRQNQILTSKDGPRAVRVKYLYQP